MATNTHYITAPCKWAKVYKPDEKYNKFSIDLGLTKEQYEDFKKIGLKNKPKEDGGLNWITLRRDPEAKAWVDGKQQAAGKPVVLDQDGKPTTQIIGNGSEVTVVYSVYDYDNKFGKGKGSRLEKVRIDKLVEYVKEQAKSNDPDIPF